MPAGSTGRSGPPSGWAGFRGAVSLAAALAVPSVLADGTPYADRNLIVFTTVMVIVVTMLVQGLTLPYVLRWAGLTDGDEERDAETRRASLKATQAALAALPELAAELGSPDDLVDRLRGEYEDHLEQLRAEGADGEDDREAVRYEQQEHELRLAVLQRKRDAVTGLRDANRIDDFVLRDLQAGLDVEELRLLGPAPLD